MAHWFKNCEKLVKTYLAADSNSDQNLVIIKLQVKLNKMKMVKRREQLNLNLLKTIEYKQKF